ncbi:hypothetical protein FB451DRAFT_602089 [Mycena latifolia]|nr:hypothetical protein FB451DRAFT_602089 [Mycena latifolia]
MPPQVSGTLSFCSTKFVDACIGIDGEDSSSSHITGDRGIFISNDGERRAEHLHNITLKKRRLRLHPNRLHDSLAQWVPVADNGDEPTEQMDSVSATGPNTKKRKTYVSSDAPMSLFPDVQQLFIEEGLWREGLGYSCDAQSCALCNSPVGTAAPTRQPDGTMKPARFFQCDECGMFLQCMECCLERHALFPLHFLDEWNGTFWMRTTLKSLGLVYQLGHSGFKCKFPENVKRSLTVIDTSGIHEIHYKYCGCNRRDTANNLVQLLRNAWFPASNTDPDTCATYAVIRLVLNHPCNHAFSRFLALF